MLHIEIIDAPVQETLARMQARIADLGQALPQELETWQREDMHRRFTNMQTPDPATATTEIWPRSRTYEKTHRAMPLPRRRPLTPPPRLVSNVGKPASTRPILRPELFDMLCTRMSALLANTLKWKASK